VLNVGKLVAPLILAFVKLVPVITAPEKFAPVSVAPENETPESVVPANDAPAKFRLAKLVPDATLCPSSADPAVLITMEHDALVGAL
jgi:hypothetical protein